MTYTCITSMHQGHIDYIGGVMLDSWKKYFPKDSRMIVYAEGFEKISNDPRITFISWEDNCKEIHAEFCKKTDDSSTQRFAKKGFAFLHAMENNTDTKLIWIDADILFYKNITNHLLDPLLPNDKLIALFDCFYQLKPNYTKEEYLDLTNRKIMAAESGFLIINPKHKNYARYVNNYKTLFTSNTKDPALVSWYDGEVAVIAAREFLEDVEDLSKLRLTNKTQTPLNKSPLAEYFNHQKGKVKKGYTVDILRKFCNLD